MNVTTIIIIIVYNNINTEHLLLHGTILSKQRPDEDLLKRSYSHVIRSDYSMCDLAASTAVSLSFVNNHHFILEE